MLDFLVRHGAVLLHPRIALSSAVANPRRDSLLLLVIYLLGAKWVPIMERVADALALSGFSALQALLPVVLVGLPWILATFALEFVADRDHQDRINLLRMPLVAGAVVANTLVSFSIALPGPEYLPELVGGVWGLALAVLFTRKPRPAADLPKGLRIQSAIIAGIVGLLATANLAFDSFLIARNWSVMAPVATGDPVPAFAVKRLDGSDFTTEDLSGNVDVLVFWTTWCGVCEDEMPVLKQIHERFAGSGVRVTAVNCDRGEQRLAAAAYQQKKQLPFAIALDTGAVKRAFRVKMYPHLVIVDQAGEIRHVHQGRVGEGTLVREIRGLLRE